MQKHGTKHQHLDKIETHKKEREHPESNRCEQEQTFLKNVDIIKIQKQKKCAWET